MIWGSDVLDKHLDLSRVTALTGVDGHMEVITYNALMRTAGLTQDVDRSQRPRSV